MSIKVEQSKISLGVAMYTFKERIRVAAGGSTKEASGKKIILFVPGEHSINWRKPKLDGSAMLGDAVHV